MGQRVNAPKQLWAPVADRRVGNHCLFYQPRPGHSWGKGFFLVKLVTQIVADYGTTSWIVECVFDGTRCRARISDLGETLNPMETLAWATI